VSVPSRPGSRASIILGRSFWLAATWLACGAWAQGTAPAAGSPAKTETAATAGEPAQACPLQPHYPLPKALAELRELSERLAELSQERACLKDANFHAWRGAVLMALGRPVEAIEPLERALLENPDLFGAQLDLAQAQSMQGDTASAAALLQDLRSRAQLPEAFAHRIDREIEQLRSPLPTRAAARRLLGEWQSSWQFSTLGGYDTNLNNAPSATELTLTLPGGDVTLPLEPSSQPRKGAAVLATAQWQGVKARDESAWVLQAEARSRHAQDSSTDYQQLDLAANWLQGPLAPRQWVGRIGTSLFRFGGETVLWATRADLQYQWAGVATGMGGFVAHCRPTAAAELERRLYPSSRNIDGFYRGAALGVLCRPASQEPVAPPVFSVQARYGEEVPFDASRPGGTYQRAEIRGQWEGRLPWRGAQFTFRWSTTRQSDTAPYSPLLGNVARSTLRHTLQFETAWPLQYGLSLITNAEGALQRSNLEAFDSRQLAFYVGLRWDASR
jgi:hypothetical protein